MCKEPSSFHISSVGRLWHNVFASEDSVIVFSSLAVGRLIIPRIKDDCPPVQQPLFTSRIHNRSGLRFEVVQVGGTSCELHSGWTISRCRT